MPRRGRVKNKSPMVGASKKKTRTRSLRGVGISNKTRIRYERMLSKFIGFVHTMGLRWPEEPAQVDHLAGMFLDHLWADDRPEGWAADFVSALKRYLPIMKRQLYVTSLLFANWRRTVSRKRAWPMTLLVLKAFVGLSLYRHNWDMAATLLVGFAGCLRCAEMLDLKLADCITSQNRNTVIVILRATKTGKRTSTDERVIIHDRSVAAFLVRLRATRGPQAKLYRGTGQSFRQELRDLGSTLAVPTSRLTPYSLRRGGATWHFREFGSLSKTTVHGRWSNERTARIYIDGALAQMGEWSIPPHRREVLESSARVAWAFLNA